MNTRLGALALSSAIRGLKRTTPPSRRLVRQAVSHCALVTERYGASLAGYHGYVGVIQNLYIANISDSI